MTDNTNPGNFANRPKEEVQAIASKGGKASGGGGSGATNSGATSAGSSGGSSDVGALTISLPLYNAHRDPLDRLAQRGETLTEPSQRVAKPPKKLDRRADLLLRMPFPIDSSKEWRACIVWKGESKQLKS